MENLASPEEEFIEKYYDVDDNAEDKSIMSIKKHFQKVTGKIISLKQMKRVLIEFGFDTRYTIVKNALPIDQTKLPEVLV